MPDVIIGGKYKILAKVGQGGSSKVYLARDLLLNKNWAVKYIKKDAVFEGQKISNSLLAEVQLMKDLDNPSLPRIVDIFEEPDKYFIVMDFVEGETLKDIINQNGPQDQDTVIAWGLELASVLHYLHSQDPPIIYRDLKPSNIILQPNQNLKLIDFGIARTYKETKQEDTIALGTKGYAAPEQFISKTGRGVQSDQRTDIYSLGVTLYELLTCHIPTEPPYELLPLRSVNRKLSQGLEKIILKCTMPNPDDRFQSVEEVMYALANYEKLDDAYMRQQKRRLRKVFVPFIIGICMIITSGALFITDRVISSRNYETLISDTGNTETNIKNLEKAISVKPNGVKAYELLIEEYAEDGFTEQESQQVLTVYNENINKVSTKSEEYLDINYKLGENYIKYFTGETDNSIRNKILTAQPFFDKVVETGDTEYVNYRLANSYNQLAIFYERYIASDDALFVQEADKDSYTKILKEFDTTLENLGNEQSNNQLTLITCDIMLSIIDSERYNMASCIKKKDVDKAITEIEAAIVNVDTANAELLQEKEDVLATCGALKEKVNATYINNEKVEEE